MAPQEGARMVSAPTEVTRKSRTLRQLLDCWHHGGWARRGRGHRRTFSTKPVYVIHPSIIAPSFIGGGDIKFVLEMMFVKWCVDQRPRLITCWNEDKSMILELSPGRDMGREINVSRGSLTDSFKHYTHLYHYHTSYAYSVRNRLVFLCSDKLPIRSVYTKIYRSAV